MRYIGDPLFSGPLFSFFHKSGIFVASWQATAARFPPVDRGPEKAARSVGRAAALTGGGEDT